MSKVATTGTYAGDEGYDDTDLHYRLKELGKHSALCLRHFRTSKKDGNKGVWLELKQTPEYQAGLAERYKVEREYDEGKHWHGSGRCRLCWSKTPYALIPAYQPGSRNKPVIMMQSGQDREPDNRSSPRFSYDRAAPLGNLLFDTLVRPGPVEVLGVFFDHAK